MVAGELDELERELDRQVDNWVSRVVIDLSDCPFLDSAALELLCRCRRVLADRGLQLKLCGLREMNQKIMELTRLSRQFQIFADTSAAVRSYL